MELQNVTKEQHELLMELGFPKECASEGITAELAAKWLREKRKLWIETSYRRTSTPPHYVSMVFGYSLRPYRQGFVGRSGYHKDYEGALSEGIDIALKTLKGDRKTQRNGQMPYQAVDLGLQSGLKWADRNIGAESPQDCGDYFMWGSTTPDTDNVCDWAHAPFNGGSEDFDKEHFNEHKSEWLTDKGVLKPEYDAAQAIMGGTWRIPTPAEIQELLDVTTQSIEEQEGIAGVRFTSNANGNSIFVPFAGRRYGSDVYNVGGSGYAWSSSINAGNANYSRHLNFSNNGYAYVYGDSRYYGFAVRGVHE